MKIFNRFKIIQLMIAFSLVLLIAVSFWTYNSQIKILENTSIGFVQQLEGLKGRIFLFNQLATQVLSSPTDEIEVLLNSDEIYSLNYQAFLKSNGVKLNNRFYQIFSPGYSWLDASALLYFKLFDTKTVLSDRPIKIFIDNPEQVERVFSKEYCDLYLNCTKYASKKNLSDGFIFSNFHISSTSNKKTLGITSPTIINGKIVAESHIDINIESWESSSGLFISSTRKGEQQIITVSNQPYRSDFAWIKTVKIDNFVTMVFERHYGTLIAQGILFSLFFVAFNTVLMFYHIEKKTHNRTKLDSMTDALTGCFNRKVLDSSILKTMMSEKLTNSVVVFDGNKIKFINDKYGHDTGDIAIQEIANAIRKSFRKEDMVIRTGGDEFVVIAFGLEVKLARNIVNDVNAYLSQKPIAGDNIVSVSAGFCRCKKYTELKKAISSADIELYANKRQRAKAA